MFVLIDPAARGMMSAHLYRIQCSSDESKGVRYHFRYGEEVHLRLFGHENQSGDLTPFA